MYNVLFLGLESHADEISSHLPSTTYKQLTIQSAIDFYSTAFSRIFDAWFIDTNHKEFKGISLEEMLHTQNIPLIFLIGSENEDADKWKHENVSLFPATDIESAITSFKTMIQNRHEQNKERYFAGLSIDQPGIESVITKSTLMQNLIGLVKDIAPTDSPILIHGETGTGKELLANIFHNESRRRSGPFMAVNCGALPDNLLESELFGYEKGAFTGAGSQRIGKIEHASGGTLFLDEIEAMSPAMQVRLLRVLQEKNLQRLGSNVEINSDFRVIGATNTDPLELINTGQLRSDLYYRLSVFQVHIPPLRDRVEDIPYLVQHIINKKKKGGREYIKGLDSQAMKLLVSVPWFGNIRELQNVIERAVMLATSEIITSDLIHIPSMPISEAPIDASQVSESAFRPGTTLKSYKNLLQQAAERKYLTELLEFTEGRIGDSAMFAGLTPRALYNKMKIHGLKKEDFRNSEK